MKHRIKCSEIWGGNRGDTLDVETSGVRASLFSRACDGGKGDDIYYFSVCRSDLLTRIALADVMGHGEAVAETGRWLYDSLSTHINSLDGTGVLADLNTACVAKGHRAMSTAAVAAFYRKDQQLYFSYAGHHALLLKRHDVSDWTSISGEAVKGLTGIPLGVSGDAQFVQQQTLLGPGDRIFLYTDGLIEAPNADEQEFGEERVLDTLRRSAGESVEHVRTSMLDELLNHTTQLMTHDDVTFMGNRSPGVLVSPALSA